MSLDTRPRALSIPSSAISFNHIICYRAQQIGLDPINVQMVFGLLNQHPCLLTRAFSAQQRYECFLPRVRILMQRLARACLVALHVQQVVSDLESKPHITRERKSVGEGTRV